MLGIGLGVGVRRIVDSGVCFVVRMGSDCLVGDHL